MNDETKTRCVVRFEEPFGKSSCSTCGRQWEAMTPKGSENHCLRELGSRLADAEKRLEEAYAEGGVRALRNEIESLRSRLQEAEAESNASFDIRWAADMRAIKRWHAAGGNKMTWPDHADLCVWLMERLEAAEAQVIVAERQRDMENRRLTEAEAKIAQLQSALDGNYI